MHLRRSRVILFIVIFCIGLFLALSFAQIHFAPPITKNIYAGTTTLDATGAATIIMPKAVMAANSSFTYQVLSAGDPMPGLYIKSTLKNSYFEAAGGTPGGVVAWQLMGTGN